MEILCITNNNLMYKLKGNKCDAQKSTVLMFRTANDPFLGQ